MPLLDTDQIDRMRAKAPTKCPDPKCGQMVSENYCRQCDVFFTEGHTLECGTMKPGELGSNNHEGHRTY